MAKSRNIQSELDRAIARSRRIEKKIVRIKEERSGAAGKSPRPTAADAILMISRRRLIARQNKARGNAQTATQAIRTIQRARQIGSLPSQKLRLNQPPQPQSPHTAAQAATQLRELVETLPSGAARDQAEENLLAIEEAAAKDEAAATAAQEAAEEAKREAMRIAQRAQQQLDALTARDKFEADEAVSIAKRAKEELRALQNRQAALPKPLTLIPVEGGLENITPPEPIPIFAPDDSLDALVKEITNRAPDALKNRDVAREIARAAKEEVEHALQKLMSEKPPAPPPGSETEATGETGIKILAGTENILPHTNKRADGSTCITARWISHFGLCYDAAKPKGERGGMYDPWLWISGPWGRCYYPASTAAAFKTLLSVSSSGRFLNAWSEKSNYVDF